MVGLKTRPAAPAATAKSSMTKRIRKSEVVQQAKCAKPRKNRVWIAGFVAINGRRAKTTGNLIRINDSIGELCPYFQTEGVSVGKSRPNGLMVKLCK